MKIIAPWYNKISTKIIITLLQKEDTVFEYGAGNSTIFFLQLSTNCYSAETRSKWIQHISDQKATLNLNNSQGKIHHCKNNEEFLNCFQNNHKNLKANLIIVDSIIRSQCLLNAPSLLLQDGLIMLDNSERENLKQARQQLINTGFIETSFIDTRIENTLDTESLKTYSLNHDQNNQENNSTSSFFYRENSTISQKFNSLNLQGNIKLPLKKDEFISQS